VIDDRGCARVLIRQTQALHVIGDILIAEALEQDLELLPIFLVEAVVGVEPACRDNRISSR